jgi:hypothetical protein
VGARHLHGPEGAAAATHRLQVNCEISTLGWFKNEKYINNCSVRTSKGRICVQKEYSRSRSHQPKRDAGSDADQEQPKNIQQSRLCVLKQLTVASASTKKKTKCHPPARPY